MCVCSQWADYSQRNRSGTRATWRYWRNPRERDSVSSSPLTPRLCVFLKFQNGFRKAIISRAGECVCVCLLNEAFNNIRWNFNELRVEIGLQQQRRRQWWNKVTPKWRFNKQNATTWCDKWLLGSRDCSLIIFWSHTHHIEMNSLDSGDTRPSIIHPFVGLISYLLRKHCKCHALTCSRWLSEMSVGERLWTLKYVNDENILIFHRFLFAKLEKRRRKKKSDWKRTANASYVPAPLIKPDKPDWLGDLTHEIVSCLFSHLDDGGSFKKKKKKKK